MMGGTTADGGGGVEIVAGQEYGRTPYSEEAEGWYEQTRGKRQSLDGAEYYAVSQGYLREWVCISTTG